MSVDEFLRIRKQNRAHFAVMMIAIVFGFSCLFYAWRINREDIDRLERKVDIAHPGQAFQ